MALTDAAAPPFPFVVGAGRSGKGLLRAMLDSHPDLAMVNRSNFLLTFALQRQRYEKPGGFDSDLFVDDFIAFHRALQGMGLEVDEVQAGVAEMAPRTLPEAVRALYRMHAAKQGKSRYGDKSVAYALRVQEISALLPETRFVHLIRDGRDAALAYLDARYGPRQIDEGVQRWRYRVEWVRREGQKLGADRYLELRYEDLLDDPETNLRRVCAFISLPFDPVMLRYFERPAIHVASAARPEDTHLVLPPTKGLIDWRSTLSAQDKAVADALAGDLLAKMGYERSKEHLALKDGVEVRRRQLLLAGRERGRRFRKRVSHRLRPRR